MLGKIVRVNQDIKEYTDLNSDSLGIIIHVIDFTQPALLTVMWADGAEEDLYLDEVEIVS